MKNHRKDTETQIDDLDTRTISLFINAGNEIGLWSEFAEEIAQEAASYLQFDEAVTLLEQEDFFQIIQKMLFLKSMFEEDEQPLYTLEELISITELYIIFLEQNQKDILEFGYSKNSFFQCPWLYLEFTNLYPSSCPLDFLSYWNDLEDLPSNDESIIINLLPQEESKRIENERSLLFDLKIMVLHRLLSALTSKSPVDLLKECLYLLKEVFFDEERIAYYFNIDKKYIELPVQLPSLSYPLVKPNPGGLTSMLNLIIRFASELEFGMKNRIRKHLQDLITMNKFQCLNLSFNSYFELINNEKGKLCFDNAFFIYLSQLDVEDTLFNLYRERGGKLLEEGKNLRSITNISIPKDVPYSRNYKFYQDGKFWVVTYEKHSKYIPHTKGMYYIHKALSKPRKRIPIFLLEEYANQEYVFPSDEEILELLEEAHSRFGNGYTQQDRATGDFHIVGFPTASDDFFDPKTRDDVQLLIEDIIENKDCDDEDSRFLGRYYAAGCGLWGKIRKVNDPWEAIRKNVSKCIKTARKNIGQYIPQLSAHLSIALKPTGYSYTYIPDREINWITELPQDKSKSHQ